MSFKFKSEQLTIQASVRLTEYQNDYIHDVAIRNKMPFARVLRQFMEIGMNSYKKHSK